MVSFDRLTEEQRASIVRQYTDGVLAKAIQKSIPCTAQTYRRVLKAAGFQLQVGGGKTRRNVAFDLSEDLHEVGQPKQAPPPPPPRRDDMSSDDRPLTLAEYEGLVEDDAVSVGSHTTDGTETFRCDRLPRPPNQQPSNPFTGPPPPPPRPDKVRGPPEWDADSDGAASVRSLDSRSDGASSFDRRAYENAALAHGRGPQPQEDAERAIVLLQVRLYAADFPERLGESVIGRSKAAQKRFHESLERMDTEELRKVLARCEMAVASSNTHEVLMGGLSMALRATESAGGMLRLRLAGYHDRMMSSPAVESLVKELRIKHIATLQQYSSPEQRLGGILLMGLVATDSHNRFRAENDKELSKPVGEEAAARYADL